MVDYSFSHKGIKLVQTCSACPKQYDAYANNEIVGYFRLRHGWFRVDAFHGGKTTVYSSYVDGDGMFTAKERKFQLENGIEALVKHLGYIGQSTDEGSYCVEDKESDDDY